jgi:hypothetical protein
LLCGAQDGCKTTDVAVDGLHSDSGDVGLQLPLEQLLTDLFVLVA